MILQYDRIYQVSALLPLASTIRLLVGPPLSTGRQRWCVLASATEEELIPGGMHPNNGGKSAKNCFIPQFPHGMGSNPPSLCSHITWLPSHTRLFFFTKLQDFEVRNPILRVK